MMTITIHDEMNRFESNIALSRMRYLAVGFVREYTARRHRALRRRQRRLFSRFFFFFFFLK